MDVVKYILDNIWNILAGFGAFGAFIAYVIFERKKSTPEKTVTKLQNQQIEQSRQTSQYNINQPNAPIVIVNLIPDNDKITKKLHKKEEFGYVRADQSEEYSFIASPLPKYEQIASKLRGFIPNNDLDNILVAGAIAKADEDGNHTLSKKLFKSMKNRFDERGNKIYSRLISNLFETRLIPNLEVIKKQEDSYEQAKNMFIKVYDSFIAGMSDVIWVSIKGIDKSRIENKIIKVKNKELEELLIFVKGDMIEPVKNICQNMIYDTNLELKEFPETKIGGEIAIMLKIISKSSKSS